MPLIIGVENGIQKGFTEDDLELINGLGFGVLMMITGTGKIGNLKTFRNRLLEANYVTKLYDIDALKLKMNLKFIQKMKDADWSCNVGESSEKEFRKEINRRLISTHEYDFRRWESGKE